jgi:cbb3-type cytochrome oxidase subunit 3
MEKSRSNFHSNSFRGNSKEVARETAQKWGRMVLFGLFVLMWLLWEELAGILENTAYTYLVGCCTANHGWAVVFSH